MQDSPLSVTPIVSAASAPLGCETLAVQWVQVAMPGVGIMLAAVARPSGVGPFPSILLLHGSHGFAQEYVQLAQDLANGEILAVAASWFQGGAGAGVRFVTPIDCPEAPPRPDAWSPEARRTVDSLIQAMRTLPDAHPERIGLFGHSRGGGAALNYSLNGGNVQAVALNSTGYPRHLTDHAAQVEVPILMLHGTADHPDDGGSAATNIQMARDFEMALQGAEKRVETVYYEGGQHNSIFTSSTHRRDEVQHLLAFFRRHL